MLSTINASWAIDEAARQLEAYAGLYFRHNDGDLSCDCEFCEMFQRLNGEAETDD